MATSITRIRAQIAKLEQQADVLKREAIKRIQHEVRAHDLTAEDIFGDGSVVETSRRSKRAAAAKPSPVKSGAAAVAASERVVKFGDGQGNFWSGIGRKPKWLKEALERGVHIDTFLVQQALARNKMERASRATARKTTTAKKAAKPGAKAIAKAPVARKRRSAAKVEKAAD